MENLKKYLVGSAGGGKFGYATTLAKAKAMGAKIAKKRSMAR